MKKNIMRAAVIVTSLVLVGRVWGQIALDSASNYGGSNPWINGSNRGFGFAEWVITTGTGSSGTFIGDPSGAGITGMSSTSFGLYANNDSGSFANADRELSSGLKIGQTFSFDWGINWDSSGGNKGVNLYVGGVSGTEVININNGGNGTITINGNDMFTEYGTQVMTINAERVSSTGLRIFATGRGGNPLQSYDNTFTFDSSEVNAFRFYASNLVAAEGTREPYFNNITVIPEPSSILMMGLAGVAAGGLAVLKRRKRG